MMMKILIDNGHGSDTAGKRSPDGRLREYAWARDVAKRLQNLLNKEGIDNVLITPETTDIALRERVRRVNNICNQIGKNNCLLISIHVNAAGGDGKWHEASGWCGYVAPNASANSKLFAQIIYIEASAEYLRGNRSVPSCHYWTGNFAIIRDTVCPAVLTENLFQDNKKEVDWLLTETGKDTIANIHLRAIKKYIAEKK